MQMAERFKMPVLTFIDTPGAYPGIDAEERGQSEAIAKSLAVMARLKTPIVTSVIGEVVLAARTVGGRQAVDARILQPTVISPEGCASFMEECGTCP